MSRVRNFFLPQYQSALGTVVHATPLVESIHRLLPDARVLVASAGLAAEVWSGNPQLERLVLTPSPLVDFVGAVQGLRRERFFGGEPYVTLLTTGNERTKITVAALLAGRSTRVGFAVHGALVQRHLTFDPSLSQIANNLRLLDNVGLAPTSAWSVEPRLYPQQQHAYAEQALRNWPSPRIALATQTSPTQRKSWPQQRWVVLAKALRDRYGANLVFLGACGEVDAIEAIRREIPFPTLSIAGKTDIQQLAAVLRQCDLGVMLDTGPLHVARGVDLPAVVIAPAWSPVHEWLPVNHPRYRILKRADFPPPAPSDYVISEVSMEDVLNAVESLMATVVQAGATAERTLES